MTEHENKKHLVCCIDDIELYRIKDKYGCQWVRVHQGINTCMNEATAKMFFEDAKRKGEIFDLEAF